MVDLKNMYKTIMDDDFPNDITIKFGDQTLIYKKCMWKIDDEKTGQAIKKGLRYGENPDQQSALYKLINGNLALGGCQYIKPDNGLVSSITEKDLIQFGKHPSKINLTDLDSGLNILKYLAETPAAVIIKHNNPCGAAIGKSISEAYYKAHTSDRIAAFGGCLVLNRSIDKQTADMIISNYLEVVAAPEFEDNAINLLSKRKNLRLIRISKINELSIYKTLRFVDFKSLIDGGLIIQQSPINKINSKEDFLQSKAIYKDKEYSIIRQPTEKEFEDMLFGWFVEQGITSNSVIYVKNGVTIGIGTGEQDRVSVAEIAVFKAYTKFADSLCFRRYNMPYKTAELDIKKDKSNIAKLKEIDEETKKQKGGLIGSIMVSDAFFPFRDGIDVGIKEGVTAIVQPGGSERDYEVIEACNEAKVTMVFTGQRAFKH